MKKTTINQSLVVLLFLMGLFAQTGFSQATPDVTNLIKICSTEVGGGVIGPSNCSDSSIEVDLNVKCKGHVDARIFATNITRSLPQVGHTYPLPLGYPDFYLRHEGAAGVWSYSGPYTDFTYFGEVPGADGQYKHLFYAEAILGTHLSSDIGCSEAEDGEVINFQMGLELLELDPTLGYIPYPAYLYAEPGNIFSCNLFEDTYCMCNQNENNAYCDNFAYSNPNYVLDICMDCEKCQALDQGPSTPTDPNDRTIVSNTIDALSLQIHPNPFEESVNLSYLAETDGTMTVSVFDAQGRLLQEVQEKVYQGNHIQSIETGALPKGIYYFHLQCGSTQVHKKLIKME